MSWLVSPPKIQLFTLSMTENDHFVLQKGGMLNLYPGGSEEPVKILPRLDRLLLFWSDRRNPHEVAPSHDVRLVYNSSLSGTYDIYAIVFVVSRIPNKFVVSVISRSQKKKKTQTQLRLLSQSLAPPFWLWLYFSWCLITIFVMIVLIIIITIIIIVFLIPPYHFY